ncbi:MAG: amidohydrolase family protein [Negativicutes bacterium]|nr:amidohydrolase family protein [Negativicutes bacterium]
MKLNNIPFFDNHTHILDTKKTVVTPLDMSLVYLHGYCDDVDAQGKPYPSKEQQEHLSNMGVVITMVNYMSQFLQCEPTLEAVVEARNKVTANGAMPYIKSLYEDANIFGSVLDCELPMGHEATNCFPAKTLRLFQMDRVFSALLASVDSYAALKEDFIKTISAAVDEGFVGLKCHVGELYTSAVRLVDDAEASAAFAAAQNGDKKACENVYFAIFAHTLLLCQKLDISIHIHTGYTGKVDKINGDIQKLDPLLMTPFLMNPQFFKTKIVFLHASYPYTLHAASLAHTFPNIYVDLGWVLPWISLRFTQCLEDVLGIAPHSKILLGTGQHGIPEMAWMAAKVARTSLSYVLDKLIALNVISPVQAEKSATMILCDNARKLYKM